MHPIVENFLSRPKKQKIAFWIGSLAVFGLLLWQFMLAPQMEEYDAAKQKVADLDKKLTDERRRAANLPRLREMVRELEEKLKVALRELPDRREIPDLIDSVSNLARDSGLEVTLFRPGEQNFKDFYAEVPVSIAVTGTFHQVSTFFDEVGHLDRIVNINQIYIHDPQLGESQVTVKVDCVATTFRYLDENERAKVAGEGDGKNQGQRRRR
ncbi:MAG: type 4a pilus biogenesis protein PilO [Deltaproteobacteria bacterium]|nr:type 4a pilus biogenesis protein PilO [Deltaproteobacteria bacterium]